jgi:Peptidase family M48
MSDQGQNSELLKPPDWLIQACELLQKQEPELWKWFSAGKQQANAREAVRLDLLKSTVELQRDSYPELFQAADGAAAALQLDIPVTIYQAQQSSGFNASVSIDTSAARIIFQGDVIERLSKQELQAVLGHELGHLILWRMDDEKLLTALRLLGGVCDDPGVHPVYVETLRLFGLYAEIFCDRCSLKVHGEFLPVIAALVKLETGLKQVNAGDYLNQAEVIRRAGKGFDDKSRGLTHPELYIRTSALHLWQTRPDACDPEIDAMIRGQISLEELDLVGQAEIAHMSRRLLDIVLEPAWMQCEATLNHARLFFDDYQFPAQPTHPNSGRSISDPLLASHNQQLGESFSTYLLLDFVSVDQDLKEPALAHAISVAGRLGFKDHFCEVARRELRMRKKQMDELESQGAAIIEKLTGKGGSRSNLATSSNHEPSKKGDRK